jgi:hypothetical protein
LNENMFFLFFFCEQYVLGSSCDLYEAFDILSVLLHTGYSTPPYCMSYDTLSAFMTYNMMGYSILYEVRLGMYHMTYNMVGYSIQYEVRLQSYFIQDRVPHHIICHMIHCWSYFIQDRVPHHIVCHMIHC